MRQNRQYIFNMSYLEFFGVLTGVRVHVSKFFRVGARVFKRGAGAESSLKNVTPLISGRGTVMLQPCSSKMFCN